MQFWRTGNDMVTLILVTSRRTHGWDMWENTGSTSATGRATISSVLLDAAYI
jgi:hypothetical protein